MEYYRPKFIMRSYDPETLRITDLWTFRSAKSNKRYIAEIEGFENEFWGIKFYWKGVEKSRNRYSLLTNDYEPRTIVRSCIEIMLEYFRRNKLVSFGFVAAPDLESDLRGKKHDNHIGNRRFRFYQRMMISLFGPHTFIQTSDVNHSLYLMLNRENLERGNISLSNIERRINQLYLGDFTLISGQRIFTVGRRDRLGV